MTSTNFGVASLPVSQSSNHTPSIVSSSPTTALNDDLRKEIVIALDHSVRDYERLKPYISWLEYQFGRWNAIGGPDAIGEIFRAVVLHFKEHVNSTIINFIEIPGNRDRLQSIVPILDNTTNVKIVARLLRLWMMLLDPEDGPRTPKVWENDRNRFFSGHFTVAEFVQAHQLNTLAISAQNQYSNGVPRSLLKAKNLQGIAGIKFVWTFDVTKHLYLEHGELHLFCMPCKIEPPSALPSQMALETFGFSVEWRSELQRSYGMIFGSSSTSGKNIFKKRAQLLKNNPSTFDRVVLKERSIGRNATSSESWEQDRFRYHWERIQILNNYLQERRSRRPLRQLLRDKSDTYGYWTIWTAIIVGILTFLGFLISAVTGILQVVKAFEGSRPIEVIIVGYKPGNVSAA